MRTSEFKEAVDKLGLNLELELNTHCAKLVKDNEKILLIVSSKKTFNMQIDYFIDELSDIEKEYVFNLAVEYASTPIAEREEEKRYRLKLIATILEEDYVALKDQSNITLVTIGLLSNPTIKKLTIFTESELKTMDLTGFEKVEVTE